MSNNQVKEINKIMEGYTQKEITKMDELKTLDKKVKRPAKVFAYTFGSVSSLVLGAGMSFAMGVIGNSMTLGIIVGVVGMGLCALTYPIYKGIMNKRKKKYADKIMALSNKLLNENN